MIFVAGCNHGVQSREEDTVFGDSDEVKVQKLHFACLLERIFRERRIQFVGEEWGLPTSSVAQRLATEGRIASANINTSLEDLDRMGIPRDYLHGRYGQAEKDRWNRPRERFMLGRIEDNRGRAENLLIGLRVSTFGTIARIAQSEQRRSRAS